MIIEISRVLHLTEFLMFRMFFISLIVVSTLYQPLANLDVVVLTALSHDLVPASGMTLPLLKRKSGVQGYLEGW